MKKLLSILLTVLLTLSAVAVTASADSVISEPENGQILYETDFGDGLPDGFRIPSGNEGRVYVKDGKLYLDAQGREFTKVLLPDTLDGYGNYEITIHATIENARDEGRWGSIMYRVQNTNSQCYPYFQMCFRKSSQLSNGVEFAIRNEQNTWNVTSTGPISGHEFEAGKFDEIRAVVRDDRAIHSINGERAVDCTDATAYSVGGIGLQANFCTLAVEDIKVTYLRSTQSASSAFVEIAQPDTNVIGGYTLSEYVYTSDALQTLTKKEVIPANAVFVMNSELQACGKDGVGFAGIDGIFTSLDGKIMPTFYVKDEAAAVAVAEYLSDNAINDAFVMSSNGDLVHKARKIAVNIRGVLDLTEELSGKASLTSSELLEIRGRTNKAFASVVVIPDNVATSSSVKYLYDRLVSVWVSAPSELTTVTEAYGIAAAGGHGALTDNTALMYKVLTEYMGSSKLLRIPLNIGHRGIPTQAPENTVEGSLLAYELGADCVENDIYLTADGQLAVMHDATTLRTTNGNLNMEGSTLAELRALVANRQYPNDERFKDVHVPSLEDYYKAFKGKDIQIFVEIKSVNRALIEKFYELTFQYGMEEQVSVITFHQSQIDALKNEFPEMSAGYLCNPLVSGQTGAEQARAVLNKIQKMGSTYNPAVAGHSAEYVKNANMRGTTTWPWTVDDKASYVSCFMMGMNGITTNDCTIPAKYAKKLTSEQYEYELLPGQTLSVSAVVTNYAREDSDVSGKVRVIPLDGDITVCDGNTLTFAGEGEFTYALEYTYKINGKNSYSIYTDPIRVSVKSPQPDTDTDVQSVSADTQLSPVTDETTQPPAETGSFPWVAVIIAAVAVSAVGIVFGIILGKKKKA